MAQWLTNPTSLWIRSLPLLSGLRVHSAVNCGVGHRHGSDPALLWLWCGPVATAPIRPLAWEPPYAAGAALEKAKRPKKKNRTEERKRHSPKIMGLIVAEAGYQDIVPSLIYSKALVLSVMVHHPQSLHPVTRAHEREGRREGQNSRAGYSGKENWGSHPLLGGVRANK